MRREATRTTPAWMPAEQRRNGRWPTPVYSSASRAILVRQISIVGVCLPNCDRALNLRAPRDPSKTVKGGANVGKPLTNPLARGTLRVYLRHGFSFFSAVDLGAYRGSLCRPWALRKYRSKLLQANKRRNWPDSISIYKVRGVRVPRKHPRILPSADMSACIVRGWRC
jgi:hypothetical protein